MEGVGGSNPSASTILKMQENQRVLHSLVLLFSDDELVRLTTFASERGGAVFCVFTFDGQTGNEVVHF